MKFASFHYSVFLPSTYIWPRSKAIWKKLQFSIFNCLKVYPIEEGKYIFTTLENRNGPNKY